MATVDVPKAGIHRDEYTVRDALDRRALVREIARTVAEDRPPLVFGVHGDWGSGKTSALRAIRYHLTGDDDYAERPDDLIGGIHQAHVVSVWFEAWRYQNEAAPVVPLIQEMRRQLSLPRKALDEARKLGEVAKSALLDCIDKAAKLIGMESTPISPGRIQSIGEQWEKDHFAAALPTDSIQSYLSEAIAGLLPPQRAGFPTPRIVVFIDDLDRCNADAAYRLLEGLKIYLSLSNCVFLLGMNQKVISEAIAERLKRDDLDTAVQLKAEAYLEKLCGNIWRLPLPAVPVQYFIELVEDAAARAALAAVMAGTPAVPSFLPPNPRRLRALANVYNRLRKAAQPDTYTSDLNLRLLVVAYAYQFHPELFQRWHYDRNFFLRIQDWVKTGQANQDSEPYFARLSLPTLPDVSTSQATPKAAGLVSLYPDPSVPGIFWIAPLLQLPLRGALPDEFQALLALRA